MRKHAILIMMAVNLGWTAEPSVSCAEDEKDILVFATARNPMPDQLPTIRVVHEKLWGKYYPMVSTSFPNVPEFTCDSWCYESSVDFLDARAIADGAMELRHRDRNHHQAIVVTTITPTPGAVEFSARMVLDAENHPDAELPDSPTVLNLCWQLRHAPAFASRPDTYPDFVGRCFIFGEKGRKFLLDAERNKIPCQVADDETNNPPWVQMYVGVWQNVPHVNADSWAAYSTERYVTNVIGTVSRDGNYLTAIANDSAASMSQAWHDCMHNNPAWLPANGLVADRRWRLKIYAMENDPEALLQQVGEDFANSKHLSKTIQVPVRAPGDLAK